MKRALFSIVLAAALLAAFPASADLVVRPPSPCRDRSAGDTCTEDDKQGTCKEEHSRLKDKSYLVCDTSSKPTATATPSTASTSATIEPSASPEPAAEPQPLTTATPAPTATSEPPPPVPSGDRGCSCDAVGAADPLGWGLGLGAAGGAVAIWVGRRGKRGKATWR